MKLKIFFLFLLFSIGFCFQNCCNCPEIDGEFFDIIGLDIIHQDQEGFFTDAENIPYEDYGFLTLLYEVDYMVYEECDHWNFSVLPSAYGCECIENGDEGSRDEMIEDVTIITMNNFNNNYMANDTINDLINVSIAGDEMDLNAFLLDRVELISDETLALTLDQSPSMDSEFQVRIRVDLSTGERYEAISRAITFQ